MTTATLGFARAYAERSSAATAGPLRFIAATEGRKADGIDLRMSGARLDRFRSNPVILYGHQSQGRDSLPIGKASNVRVRGKQLLIDVVFDEDDPFAADVARKYRSGFLNAVSAGFRVLKWQGSGDSMYAGGVALDWELLEVSAVPVPLDPDAVVESGRAAMRSLGREILRLYGGEQPTRNTDARGLLDAISAPSVRPPRGIPAPRKQAAIDRAALDRRIKQAVDEVVREAIREHRIAAHPALFRPYSTLDQQGAR